MFLVVSLLALVALLFLRENNQQTTEDANDVVEQIQRVGNAVVATETVLLHNHLRIEQDESGHDGQAYVEIDLLHKVRAEQQIADANQGHCAQSAHQYSAEEQIATAFGQNRRSAQTGEDGSGAHQSCDDNRRIDEDNLLQQQTQRVPGEGTKTEQQPQANIEVFAVIRSEDQAQNQAQGNQSTEQSSFPNSV